MNGNKSNKQRKKELSKRKSMVKKLTKTDMIRIGKSTDKGQK
jgi:hypothetical protein